ncbi:MAG TPA: hypothetical protein VLE49_16725 [Anaerolineales bacterium]|nr:hypothetical protein [Anaerolineales bacterium]
MKYYRICLAIAILVLASLACQALGGGSSNTPSAPPVSDTTGPDSSQPTAVNSDDNNSGDTVKTDFPMTPDAYNVMQAGGGLIFYTKLSLEDAMKFYRDTYTSKGYTERKELTVVSNGTFSLVFDGDPSGKAVVVQSVDLGDGSRTISIRLEAA